MSTVRARGLVAQVHDEMRARIGAGEFPPGTAMNIADMAKGFGISPTPVREAFARLAAEGHLHFVDNIGYSIPPLPSAQDYVDWATARVVVESNALLYILGPIDTRLLDEAQALNDRIRATDFGVERDGILRYSELNWQFHAKLIALARNPLLDRIHAQLYAAPQFSRIFLGRGILNQAQVAKEHDGVLRRLRRGDRAAASHELREHIVNSLQRDARLADASISLRRVIREAAGSHPPLRRKTR